jgi:mono/diheme cytochrome c family protein
LISNGAKCLALAFALAPALSGCTQMEDAAASIPVFSFMRNSPAIDPYEAPRPAPYGSVPYGSPAGESLGPTEASEEGLNALAGRITNPFTRGDTTAMRVGQVMFDRHCAVCHGPQGKGNGPILGQGKFPFAPDLTLPTTRARSDGYIYAVIRTGRGLMPSYGPRTNHLERWAIVEYVRSLSGAAPAPAATPVTAPTTAPATEPGPVPAPATGEQ